MDNVCNTCAKTCKKEYLIVCYSYTYNLRMSALCKKCKHYCKNSTRMSCEKFVLSALYFNRRR